LNDKVGKFRFHLKAPNGEIIVESQAYAAKANAQKGIEAIKIHAPGGGPHRLTRSSDQRQFPSDKVYRRDDRGTVGVESLSL